MSFYITSIFFAVMFTSGTNAAELKFTISQTQSGGIIGPLNTVGDDLCAAPTSPGCDFSNIDNIIRTNDDIEFQFNTAVGPDGDDPVVLNAELDPGLIWTALPSICDVSTSSITGDGTVGNSSVLNCDLGERKAWSSTFNVSARALGSNLNGTQAGIASASIDAPASTKVDVLNIPPDVTITASPRMNLKKEYRSTGVQTVSGVTYIRVIYSWWIETWKHDTNGNTSDDPDPFLGNEMIVGPVTFTEDPSTVSPNAYIQKCETESTNAYPYLVYNDAFPERSVLNAGTSACANTGPTATGPTVVTVTGADFSLNHTPTETLNGSSISSDRKIATFGTIRILVPTSDVTGVGGSLSSVNALTNFDPLSISNVSNLDEDESDNTVARTLTAGSGKWSKLFRHSIKGEEDAGKDWSDPPTNASGNRSGDGLIQAGQYFATSSSFNNDTFGSISGVEVCDVIDTNLYEFAATNIDAGKAHRVIGAGMAAGTEGTDYKVEYGVGYVGTWPPIAYPNPAALNTECSDPSVVWYSSFTAAKNASTPSNVTKVKYTRITPQPVGSGHLMLKHRVKTTSAPNGTLLVNMATVRSDLVPQWRNCKYVAGAYPTPTHTHNSCGDRLTLTQATARVVKTTVPNDSVDVVQSGGTVKYKLAPNFTSVNPITDTIIITDNLPVGVSYAVGSAVWNGVQSPPVVTGSPATGQTLTWNLGTWTANITIPAIEFEINVPITANNGDHLDNTATIEAITDGSSEAQRSDTRRVTVSSPASLLLAKTTDTPLENQESLFRFVVEYFNGTDQDINASDIIDILPFNGDNRSPASNYTGSYVVSPLTYQSTNGTAYYTNRTPSSVINNDPQHISNAIPGGITKWCTTLEFNTLNCPTGYDNVTAVRLKDNALLKAKTSRTMTVEFTPIGNFGGEVYTNIAQGTGQGVELSAYSPYATSRVIEKVEIGLAKNLSAQNGLSYTFSFMIENLGNTHLSKVSLNDNFDTTFGSGNYTVTSLPVITVQPTGGSLTANSLYSGSGANINLLDATAVNSLPAGTSATITLTILLDTITDQGLGLGKYENSAITEGTSAKGTTVNDISDDGNDTDSNDDGDGTDTNENDPTPINANQVNLGIIKTVNDPTPNIGDIITYRLEVKNLGPAIATNVSVTDVVPNGFEYVPGSMSTATGITANDPSPTATPSLIWTIATLAVIAEADPGTILTFQAKVKAP